MTGTIPSRFILTLFITSLTLSIVPRAVSAQLCTGDCNEDAAVTVDEIVLGISLALGTGSRGDCLAYPERVTVDLIIQAIDNGLRGCPSERCRDEDGFDDHALPCLRNTEDFTSLAREEHGRSLAKFTITNFESVRSRQVFFADANFYTLHDEWYWYRLLNGQSIPGDTIAPVESLSFVSIEEVYEWARGQVRLPLDLRFTSDGIRLFSGRFYDRGLNDPRLYGLGSLLHVAANEELGRSEVWAFQLEFIDEITHPQLLAFFSTLQSSLPPEIAEQLVWAVRSQAQEDLARQIEAAGLQFHDRIIRYSELAFPGETEVYSSALSAGSLRLFPAADGGITHANPGDIAVVDQIPDFLPPVAGLITSLPQTPLAHVNLLARNRGIPNVYRAGSFDDPFFQQLAEVAARVAVRALEPDTLNVIQISEADFLHWLGLSVLPNVSVSSIHLATAPYFLSLSEHSLAEVEALRPLIGGKSAGFLALLEQSDVSTPERPLAVTIRSYAEHLDLLQPSIDSMFSDLFFELSAPIRFLVLEGVASYDERYPSQADIVRKQDFLDLRPPGNLSGDIVRNGGLKAMIRDQPISAETLSLLTDELESRFGHFAVAQGLRFRSSSTVEDIEGFSGAGLYESNTGFLDPEAQNVAKDRKKSVEWAFKKTWASYWNFQAFEERRLANIDHLSGHMGVLVHARFDDPKEIANGVVTFTLFPNDLPDEGNLVTTPPPRALMNVNVQLGDLSVTNPDPSSGELPEIDLIELSRNGGNVTIQRVRASTLVNEGEVVLDDELLQQLFAQTQMISLDWLAQSNASLRAEQARRVQILDFEIRYMDTGWPALRDWEHPAPRG